jgi:ABC-type xylose transport system substrate-binding protein
MTAPPAALTEHNLAGKALVSGQDADLAAIIRISTAPKP